MDGTNGRARTEPREPREQREPRVGMRIEVDADDCTGCGLCEERAPQNLEIDPDEAIARVAAQPASEAEADACREAAEYCPIGALSVADDDTRAEESARAQENDEGPSAAAAAAVPSS